MTKLIPINLGPRVGNFVNQTAYAVPVLWAANATGVTAALAPPAYDTGLMALVKSAGYAGLIFATSDMLRSTVGIDLV